MHGEPVHVGTLALPQGGPERLYAAALEVRCRFLLGEALGEHLVAIEREAGWLTLAFDAPAWMHAARRNVKRIAPRLAEISRGAKLAFTVAPLDAAEMVRAVPAFRSVGRREKSVPSGTARERLEHAAQTCLGRPEHGAKQ